MMNKAAVTLCVVGACLAQSSTVISGGSTTRITTISSNSNSNSATRPTVFTAPFFSSAYAFTPSPTTIVFTAPFSGSAFRYTPAATESFTASAASPAITISSAQTSISTIGSSSTQTSIQSTTSGISSSSSSSSSFTTSSTTTTATTSGSANPAAISPTPASSKGQGLSDGAIAGIIVGLLGGLLLFGLLAFLFRRDRRRRRERRRREEPGHYPPIALLYDPPMKNGSGHSSVLLPSEHPSQGDSETGRLIPEPTVRTGGPYHREPVDLVDRPMSTGADADVPRSEPSQPQPAERPPIKNIGPDFPIIPGRHSNSVMDPPASGPSRAMGGLRSQRYQALSQEDNNGLPLIPGAHERDGPSYR